MQAVRLLRELGYRNLRHYTGGMSDWMGAGLAMETSPEALARLPAHVDAPAAGSARHRPVTDVLDALGERTATELGAIWLGMVLVFTLLYWVGCSLPGSGLVAAGEPVRTDLHGLLTSLYFSCVTATSVGYGDVTPQGLMRALAVLEAVAELLIFGGLVSKFVSRRQELLIEQIHRSAFEENLGRVRSNLHLVLSELQELADLCGSGDEQANRVLSRAESTIMIFYGEMRAIHDLLYRPYQQPDELVLDLILAALGAGMQELENLVACVPPSYRDSDAFRSSLTSIAGMAGEICGVCVPRTYAENLRTRMDRIQLVGHRLTSSA